MAFKFWGFLVPLLFAFPAMAELNFYPDQLAFGKQPLNKSAGIASAFVNHSGRTIEIYADSNCHGDFTYDLVNCGYLLEDNEECNIYVYFKPTQPGIQQCYIHLSDDIGAQQTLQVSGTGF